MRRSLSGAPLAMLSAWLLSRDLGKAGTRRTRISGYGDKITRIDLRGNEPFFMTHANAPRKHVLKLDLRKPQPVCRRPPAAGSPFCCVWTRRPHGMGRTA